MPYRVVPVISKLRRKPLMQGHDEPWVLRGILNLRAIGEGGVLQVDLSSTSFQRGQPGHIFAMNFGGIREIALAKLFGLLLKMRLDQRNLLAIRGVFGRDGLPATILQRLKHMYGLFEIEGHDLCPPCGHVLLTGRRCANAYVDEETG